MVESSGTLRDSDLREGAERQYARVDPLAILTLVLGFFGCVTFSVLGLPGLPVPLAAICGIVSLKRIRGSKGGLVGTPVAVAGIVLWLALLGGRYYYDLSTAAKQRHGLVRSEEVASQFFDRLSRGYLHEASALLSEGGKKRFVGGLKTFSTQLKELERFKGVLLKRHGWKTDRSGRDILEMDLELRFQTRKLNYIVATVYEKDDWRIDEMKYVRPPKERPIDAP